MGELNWDKVESILDKALDLPEEKRAAFVEKECRGNLKLKKEVELILTSISDSKGWLENPKEYKEEFYNEVAEDLEQISAQQSLIGEEIGAYTIKKKVGQGGMGSVYLAERTNGDFKHRVAIKLIRNSRATEENIKRFRQEKRILANLNHPSIAQLYDGGRTDSGIPYIIMEYVDGVPITEYCITQNCTVNKKIELFKQVLEAVQNAHENLTIHRDLKPDNILIDQSGNVKILDFGISKLLEEDQDALQTKTGSHLLTPRYASPEQIRQEPVTTATDLYSLGVVLFKLFTNADPIDLTDMTEYQAGQAILNKEPTKPSEKVSDPHLKKKLQGDLDAIVLKAIRKEPESRYRGAKDFINDLENFQAGLPVSAREDSLQYRTQKFLKRHKQGIAVATGVLALIVALTAFYAYRITHEKNVAQLEAEKSQEITSFVIGLLEENYPQNSQGDTITVRQILDKSVSEIQTLDKSPEVKAKLLQVIGHAYNSVGEPQKAKPLLGRSINILDSIDVSNVDLAHTYNVSGIITRDLGKLDSAQYFLQKAVDMLRNLEEKNIPEYPKALKNLAYVLRVQSDYEQALALVEEALQIEQQLYEAPDVNIAETIYILASINRYLGNYEDALKFQMNSLEMIEAITTGPHPGIVANLSNIAVLFNIMDSPDSSKIYYNKALKMAETLYGPNHPEVANLSSNISSIYIDEDKYDSAEVLIKRALDITRKTSGEHNPRYGNYINNYGKLYFQKGEYAKADSVYQIAQQIFEESYDPNHPEIANMIQNRADVAHALNDLQKAQSLQTQALEIRRENFNIEHPKVQYNLGVLINIYQKLNQPAKADSLSAFLVSE